MNNLFVYTEINTKIFCWIGVGALKKYSAFIIISLVIFIFTSCKLGNRLQELRLEPSNLTLEVGASQKITISAQPTNADISEVQWSNSQPEIAEIDNTGLVTAKLPGSTVITVKSKNGKVSVTSTIVVKEKSVKSVVLNKKTIAMEVGSADKLQAQITPADAGNKSVSWISSDIKIASVDKDGNIKAISQGSADIIVKTEDGQFTDKCTVTVKPKPTTVTNNKSTDKSKTTQNNTNENKVTGITGDINGSKVVIYENGKQVGIYNAHASINPQPYQLTIRCSGVLGPVLNFRSVVNINGKTYEGTGKTDYEFHNMQLPWGVAAPKGTTPIQVYIAYKGKEFKVNTSVYVR